MLTYVALSLVTADPSECTRHSSSRTNCLASGHHGCAWHARAANPSAGTCGEVPQCSERAKGGCPYRQTHGVGGGAAWDASHRECFEHNGICHNASTCFDLDHTECTSHDADSCTKATVCEHPWPLPLQCAERCSLTHDPVENENGLTPANFRPYVEWSLDESEPLVERGPVHTAPDANASNAASAAKGPTAKVSFGTLTGTADDEADAYLGIPFADPPVEDLRWEAPRDWSAAYSGGERDASVYGSTCMQSKVYTPALQMSESCLYLNVWTPAGSSQVQSTVNDTAAALPVMIFIYGGGCSSGSSSLQGYNGAHLAATENVIVVSMNYRVAAFGFLSLQSQADAKETTGNFGLLDQQSALRWVQNEIAAFGGDASRVMLFGESAGSMAVCAHLAMPSSKGLFSAVLMQSRSCTARPLAQGLVGADLSGDAELMAQTKCKDVACLRALSSDKVLSSTASSSWLPVIDGVVIKSDPMVILESGGANTKNVIVGTNTEEGSVFIIPYYSANLNKNAYTTALNGLFGTNCCDRAWSSSDTATVLAMYPESGNSKNRDQLIQLKTDYLFVCPARRVARAIVANGGNAYMYRFNSQIDIAVTQGWGVTVYHGAELPFVFGQEYVPWTDANVAFSSSERSLSDDVMHAWANFARSGSPTMEANGTTKATKSFSFSWPSFTKSGDINAVFAIGGSTTETGLRKSVCDVWDTLPQPFK